VKSWACDKCGLRFFVKKPPFCPCGAGTLVEDAEEVSMPEFPADLKDHGNYVGPTGELCQTVVSEATDKTPEKLKLRYEDLVMEKCGSEATFRIGDLGLCEEHFRTMMTHALIGGLGGGEEA